MKTTALDTHGIQKSFYGKAKTCKGAHGTFALYSYGTLAAVIEDGRLYRVWHGWSATTARHVDAFCREHGITAPNKREWHEMPCVEWFKHDGVSGESEFVPGEYHDNWVNAKGFFRSLGGKEYTRNGVHYSKDPNGRLVHKVRFQHLISLFPSRCE